MKRLKQVNRRQRGSSLLEVLVAVIIFSVGLLGLAGMQLKALKFNQDSLSRSTAVVLAYEVLDQMRTNVSAAQAGDYDLLVAGSSPTGDSIAKTDLKKWVSQLAALLPDGKGTVCRRPDATAATCTNTGDVFVITITWSLAGTGGSTDLIDASSQSITILGQL